MASRDNILVTIIVQFNSIQIILTLTLTVTVTVTDNTDNENVHFLHN